jgi:hypothetical protein
MTQREKDALLYRKITIVIFVLCIGIGGLSITRGIQGMKRARIKPVAVTMEALEKGSFPESFITLETCEPLYQCCLVFHVRDKYGIESDEIDCVVYPIISKTAREKALSASGGPGGSDIKKSTDRELAENVPFTIFISTSRYKSSKALQNAIKTMQLPRSNLTGLLFDLPPRGDIRNGITHSVKPSLRDRIKIFDIDVTPESSQRCHRDMIYVGIGICLAPPVLGMLFTGLGVLLGMAYRWENDRALARIPPGGPDPEFGPIIARSTGSEEFVVFVGLILLMISFFIWVDMKGAQEKGAHFSPWLFFLLFLAVNAVLLYAANSVLNRLFDIAIYEKGAVKVSPFKKVRIAFEDVTHYTHSLIIHQGGRYQTLSFTDREGRKIRVSGGSQIAYTFLYHMEDLLARGILLSVIDTINSGGRYQFGYPGKPSHSSCMVEVSRYHMSLQYPSRTTRIAWEDLMGLQADNWIFDLALRNGESVKVGVEANRLVLLVLLKLILSRPARHRSSEPLKAPSEQEFQELLRSLHY